MFFSGKIVALQNAFSGRTTGMATGILKTFQDFFIAKTGR